MSPIAYRRFSIARRAMAAACIAASSLITLLVLLASPVAEAAAPQPARATSAADVSIVDFAFAPSVITLPVGSSVTWTNDGAFPHTSTSDVGSLDPWDSGTLNSGGTFSKTFASTGVYSYHCAIHPDMLGTVVIFTPTYTFVPLIAKDS